MDNTAHIVRVLYTESATARIRWQKLRDQLHSCPERMQIVALIAELEEFREVLRDFISRGHIDPSHPTVQALRASLLVIIKAAQQATLRVRASLN